MSDTYSESIARAKTLQPIQARTRLWPRLLRRVIFWLVFLSVASEAVSVTMQHTVLVHDPKTYTQDWMNVRTWRVKPYPDVIMEYSCEENNLQNLFDGAIKVWKAPDDDDR